MGFAQCTAPKVPRNNPHHNAPRHARTPRRTSTSRAWSVQSCRQCSTAGRESLSEAGLLRASKRGRRKHSNRCSTCHIRLARCVGHVHHAGEVPGGQPQKFQKKDWAQQKKVTHVAAPLVVASSYLEESIVQSMTATHQIFCCAMHFFVNLSSPYLDPARNATTAAEYDELASTVTTSTPERHT